MEISIIYQLKFKKEFFEDLDKHKKSGQKKLLEKIDHFLDELENHPITGTGKPEELKGYGSRSVYSRRINQKHRLVYEIFEAEKVVKILACYGYYDEN